MDRSVFISYSHDDGEAVRRDAELLRAGGVLVFIDVRDIAYGERWRDVLRESLLRCERVLVFWSAAARVSEWVEREWRFALELGKKIVPTLLDPTPLPLELAEFQAVARFNDGRPRSAAPVQAAPEALPVRAAGRTLPGRTALAAACALTVGAGVAYLAWERPAPQSATMPPPVTAASAVQPQAPVAAPNPAAEQQARLVRELAAQQAILNARLQAASAAAATDKLRVTGSAASRAAAQDRQLAEEQRLRAEMAALQARLDAARLQLGQAGPVSGPPPNAPASASEPLHGAPWQFPAVLIGVVLALLGWLGRRRPLRAPANREAQAFVEAVFST